MPDANGELTDLERSLGETVKAWQLRFGEATAQIKALEARIAEAERVAAAALKILTREADETDEQLINAAGMAKDLIAAWLQGKEVR